MRLLDNATPGRLRGPLLPHARPAEEDWDADLPVIRFAKGRDGYRAEFAVELPTASMTLRTSVRESIRRRRESLKRRP